MCGVLDKKRRYEKELVQEVKYIPRIRRCEITGGYNFEINLDETLLDVRKRLERECLRAIEETDGPICGFARYADSV